MSLTGKFSVYLLVSFLSLGVVAQPVISSFSPVSGPAGTSVTITGNNFSSTAAGNIVHFGAVRATVTSATTTSLVVTAPAGTTHLPITVSANGLVAYSAKPFILTFSGAAPEFTSGSFGYIAHADSLSPGNETNNYAIGDLNNDGKIDLVTVDKPNNAIWIYKNMTTGGVTTFAQPTRFTTGLGPRSITIGDVDGNGDPDIVVSNYTDNTVSVFRNTTVGGLISFASKIDIPTNSGPSEIVVTDLDKDGKPDLIVNTINLDGYVSVLRNTGNAGIISFGPRINLQSIGGSIESITAGDLDGDGLTDIAVPNYALNAITVFRNISVPGFISFQDKMDIPVDTYPHRVVIADLNNDDKPDLSVSYVLVSEHVSVLRNTSTTGNISFAGRADYETGETIDAITVSDLNGDGKPDIAVANGIDSISLFRNISTAGGPIQLAGIKKINNIWPGPLFAADFDEDGRPDLSVNGVLYRVFIWGNKTHYPQITSVTPLQAGVGTTITINGFNFTGITAVSFGGIAAASFTVVNATTITAVLATGASGDVTVTNAIGTATLKGFIFAEPSTISSFSPQSAGSGVKVTIRGTNFKGVQQVSFGGVAAQGYTVVNDSTITAFVGAGASGNVMVTTLGGSSVLAGFIYLPKPDIISFTPTTGSIGTMVTFTGNDFTGVTSVQFGGVPAASYTIVSANTITAVVQDGATGNVTMSNAGGTDTLAGFTYISPGVPSITSFAPKSGATGTSVNITGTNFNPVAASNIVYFGPVRATVTAASASSLSVTVPVGANYNPISVTNNFLTAYSVYPFLTTFPGGGNISVNSFDTAQKITTGRSPIKITMEDFDGDDKPDLATVNYIDRNISILRNISTGGDLSFAPKVDYTGLVSAWGIVGADLDGDGRKDIITIDNDDIRKKVSIFRNTSTPGNISFAPIQNYDLPEAPQDIVANDMDRDGKPDLVIIAPNSIVVMRNTSTVSNISFKESIKFPTGVYTIAVSAMDLDGDGKADIMAVNDPRDSVYVFRNTSLPGQLSFDQKVKLLTSSTGPISLGPSDIKAGDLNNDGKPDLVVANYSANSVGVLTNLSVPGTIAFSNPIDLMTGELEPWQLALEDMDGDGKLDISFLHEYVPRAFGLIKNTSTAGKLTFEDPVEFAENINGQFAGSCTGDLDGDGRPEFIATSSNSGPDNLIYVYKNQSIRPRIISFAPVNGLAGDTVIIKGINFTGATAVFFGTVAATTFSVVTDTSIKAVIGAGEPGDVRVITPLGTATLSGFLYGHTPTIISFTPDSARALTTITITGTNFTDVTAVRFGGSLAQSFIVNSPESITATIGYGSSGAVSITAGGGIATKDGFIYIPPPPTIVSFSPQTGTTGSTVSINGSFFTGANAVSFGGVPAKSFSVENTTLIRAVVGNGATGSVSVTTLGGVASKTGFTYTDPNPPVITSFTPAVGMTGTTVTITGSNFTGATAVYFGGTRADTFTVVNATTIMAVVANGASGTVSVVNTKGTGSKDGFVFTGPPTITSFTPTTGVNGNTITITGTNLTGTTAVSFGSSPASSFKVVSSTTVTAVLANGASGAVSITTPLGTASLPGFNYIPSPVISSFTPVEGPEGTVVTITGLNLAGATAVSFGGIPAASFSFTGTTIIKAVVATGNSGDVVITTAGGTVTMPGFRFIPAPVILSMEPGAAIAGTTITIRGTGLTGATAVTFGGVAAGSFTVVNDSTITAVTPVSPSGNVQVTTAGGMATLSGYFFIQTTSDRLFASPNPAHDFVYVQYPLSGQSSRLDLFTSQGVLIRTKIIAGGTTFTALNIQGVTPGLYRLVWKNENKRLTLGVMIY